MDLEQTGFDSFTSLGEDDALDDLNERVSGNRNEWLRFVVNRQDYGVSVLQVQEILCAGDITPVSGAPHFVLGVINVRGNIVTVVDARRRLRLPPRAADDSIGWIVILDVDDQHVGLVVDEVLEVQVLNNDNVENLQGDMAFEVEGVIETEAGMMILVDARMMAGMNEVAGEQGAAA
ncbi:MAG: chemotaxis protein CheW [Haliea sp.]